ncbi:hypothetical protein [Gorillibacterium massiliense]|uniref:hypothetical protein n=1 Tax=Gorillibacterium massiliense TaxID=1280390 RepID=UPI0004ADF9CD|nr:hypothetical protein [Gorillibacterium massiliense]
MTGRNSRPEDDGQAAEPSRLDQFGQKLSAKAGDREASKKIQSKGSRPRCE